MILCGRHRLWGGDRGQPGGRINLCGIYLGIIIAGRAR